jgi:hypothetical protein
MDPLNKRIEVRKNRYGKMGIEELEIESMDTAAI